MDSVENAWPICRFCGRAARPDCEGRVTTVEHVAHNDHDDRVHLCVTCADVLQESIQQCGESLAFNAGSWVYKTKAVYSELPKLGR